MSDTNDMRGQLEDAIEAQSIDTDDQAVDEFVAFDGLRVEGADIAWDSASVTISAPGRDLRSYGWNEVASIGRNERRDVVLTFDDASSVAIACRVIA